MTILKTYARLFVNDTETVLPLYESLVGRPADLRFRFEKADIAAVGDFLIIGGPAVETAKYRGTVGPVIVGDLDVVVDDLVRSGARVEAGPLESATGTFFYLTHPDGVTVEYVQWAPAIAQRVLAPRVSCPD
jgi:hypothetical protein